MILGAVGGVLLGYFAPAFSAQYLKIFGDLFLRALKMIIVPLVVLSMICGVASLGDVRRIGKLGGATIFYYMTTTFIAVLLGLVLVNVVNPGGGTADTSIVEQPTEAASKLISEKSDYTLYSAITDVIMGFLSDNIVGAAAEMDILPLIIFSLILGGILTTIPKGAIVIEVAEGLNDAVMIFIRLIMYTAPIGILGLVSAKLGEASLQDDGAFYRELEALSYYAATVIAGLLIHGVIILSAIVFFIGKKNPFTFFLAMGKQLVTSLATSSSAATMPVTIECLERNAGVSPRSARFVAPLGATINMDGTALYEAVAVMFIAQSLGMEITLGQQVVIFFTATLAAIGAAAIPQAGLVTMILVLKAVDIPVEGIGLILVIDWFLDRCRTVVNVWGDAVGAAVMDQLVPLEKN
jgi:Na+/H+-dicarboxylate symporter